jgi:hypothetical protein
MTGVQFLAGGWKGIFLFPTLSRLVNRSTQSHIQWVPGTLSLGVKWLGYETDCSPPSSAEVKNGVMPPHPHMCSWHSAYLSTRHIFIMW